MNSFGGIDSGKYVYKSDKTPRLYQTITPDLRFRHLGDLINIVQRYADSDLIVGAGTCPCCGHDIGATLRFICELLQCRLKVTAEELPHASVVRPSWCETPPLRWPGPYRKAVHPPLPKTNIITCQFDARTNPSWWKKTLPPETIAALKPILGNPINIGDKPIPGFDNRMGLCLHEKYHLLASSILYIGIDSGITHLALMAGVKTVVLHNEDFCPTLFYPDSEDLTFISQLDDLAALVRSQAGRRDVGPRLLPLQSVRDGLRKSLSAIHRKLTKPPTNEAGRGK